MKWNCLLLGLSLVCWADVHGAFELAGPDRSATVFVPASEPECVRLAAEDLVSDAEKITGQKLALVRSAEDCGENGVVMISLDRPESAALLEKLSPGFGGGVKGRWEAYRVGTVRSPDGARLIIAGSDERGTMFGLYAFIEEYLQVDPLYYWASRPPAKRAKLAWENIELTADEPTFRFRGWFINDEDLLTEFRADGGDRKIDYPFYHQIVSPSVSARVYEAAVRLRMNTIIPASFVDIRNPAEARLVDDAARRGLFVSMHHVEPVGVSAFGFDNYWKAKGETVPFAITKHPEKFHQIWAEYAGMWAKHGPQVIWQLGLRGIADRPVWLADPGVPKSDEGRGQLISEAMAKQWEIIRKVDKRAEPLATTTLWMEGAALHEAGHLKFPEGVAVIFSDNSPGWELQEDFRKVEREAGRPYGIYYHHQLWGTGPHLVQGVSPWRTHKIFKQAVGRGSTHYAMLNVSNVREFVLGLAASARMLRDFDAFDPGRFLTGWCEEHFGAEAAAAEAVYRKHFSSFLADAATGKRAMLDGEWMHAGLRLAKYLAGRLEKGGKSDGKTMGILRQLRVQRGIQEEVGFGADQIAPRLKAGDREFFESNLVAQHRIMLGLLRWVEHVAEADLALDGGDADAVGRHIKATREAIGLLESGKALASRGEFKDWYRGDRKMDCVRLNEWSAKLEAAFAGGRGIPDAKGKGAVRGAVGGFPRIGKLVVRHAREITSSTWSVGGETMDRDFAIYNNYKEYLGPLGAKAIRLQAGWAKCEKVAGQYDWAWLDEIIDDALAQGVRPWLEASYGNPIYPDGGGTGLGGGMPKSPEALAGWDRWVAAMVARYKDRVTEWEIWNEPDGGHGITADAFAEFHLRTATIIRSQQPAARIYALALASTGKTEFAETLLKLAKERGQLGLIDAITIHGYPRNPDDTGPVERFRELVSRYSDRIEIRQGETGAPSGETVGALRAVPWTEVKQAKWDLRRMLAHHGKGVPFNLFTLCELKYSQPNMTGFNRKGLLRCNEDMTVAGPKLAYFAAQRVFSIFDDNMERIADFKFEVVPGEKVAAFGYRKRAGGAIAVTAWLSGAPPEDSNVATPIDLSIPGARFDTPVFADLMSGDVHEIPADRCVADAAGTTFKRLPLYDAPVLIAEKAALPIRESPAPAAAEQAASKKEMDLHTVTVNSSKDGEVQKAIFYCPPEAAAGAGGPPVPLLVWLHSWSGGYEQGIAGVTHGKERKWVMIAPDFRGPNIRPEACASDLAVQDVLDAVEYARRHARVDGERIYVFGSSGGGHMALMMAARARQLWAGVSAWVPISDLAAWHTESLTRQHHYAGMLVKCCGGPPSPHTEAEYRRRSPLFHLAAAKGLPLDINAGIHDGHTGSVPVSQSVRAFNALAEANGHSDRRVAEDAIGAMLRERKVPVTLAAEREDDPERQKPVLFRRVAGAARLTIFEGGHDCEPSAALEWLSRQRRGTPADHRVGTAGRRQSDAQRVAQ